MVANIEEDYILLLVYSILYKECNLTRYTHQKTLLRCSKGLFGLRVPLRIMEKKMETTIKGLRFRGYSRP